jgi:ubiquinone/menaquinone biosynthesis C-methylase UbiE
MAARIPAPMGGDMSSHVANEQRTVEQFRAEVPFKKQWAAAVFTRLQGVAPVGPPARVLDIGAAGGAFVVACGELGYDCIGVEPWAPARARAAELAVALGRPVRVVAGSAESIPFPDGSFDIVHASSVIEHVTQVDRAIAEIHRVLVPGGVFWFNAASAMCPRQEEISGFPLFGWYPDPVKQRIMRWARDKRPALVSFTKTPAINWFTPGRARTLLGKHGFRTVYDRWDLRRPDEGGAGYRAALSAIRGHRAARLLADMMVPGCSYAAIK